MTYPVLSCRLLSWVVSRLDSRPAGREVDDRATAAFMPRFYDEAMIRRRPWDEALRAAQLAMPPGEVNELSLVGDDGTSSTRGLLGTAVTGRASNRTRSPYYWGGFQLVGTP